MLKLYIIGLCILIIAILANAIVIRMGLKSWYDFIDLLNDLGKGAFAKLSAFDYLWLFVGYPLVLGGGYYVGVKIYELIF